MVPDRMGSRKMPIRCETCISRHSRSMSVGLQMTACIRSRSQSSYSADRTVQAHLSTLYEDRPVRPSGGRLQAVSLKKGSRTGPVGPRCRCLIIIVYCSSSFPPTGTSSPESRRRLMISGRQPVPKFSIRLTRLMVALLALVLLAIVKPLFHGLQFRRRAKIIKEISALLHILQLKDGFIECHTVFSLFISRHGLPPFLLPCPNDVPPPGFHMPPGILCRTYGAASAFRSCRWRCAALRQRSPFSDAYTGAVPGRIR